MPEVSLVDSHCHLDYPEFAQERDAVIQQARDAGVGHFLTISTYYEQAAKVIAIAEAYPDVSCSIGTHPDNATAERHITTEMLIDTAGHYRVIALGECGLDYHNNESSVEDQEIVFRNHIRAGLETGLPLVIHTRNAEDDTMRLLREEATGTNLKAVLHCFSSSRKLAEEALDFGLSISFSGIVTFKNAVDIQETAKIVPADRLLVETDAPFLAPVPKRGKRNEPAFVVHTAKRLAELREIPFETLAMQSTKNFFTLFNRAQVAW